MSQTEKLYNFLKSGEPVRTDFILREVYGGDHLGLARVGARVWDIKKKYKVKIKGWKDKNKKSLYWYQIDDLDLLKPIIPFSGIKPLKNDSGASGEALQSRLDWDSARKVIQQAKQQKFINRK